MPSTKSLPITPLSLRNQLFFGMWLMALSLSRQRCVVSAFQATRTSVSQCGLMIPSTRLFETTTGDAEEEYVATASLLEKLQNTNNIRDQCISAISGDGSIKVTVATVRNMINDLSLQHTMTEVPTDALGRTVTCGLLMANGMQDEQTVQITLNGDGPIRGVVAIASGDGAVRGYVGSPMLGQLSLKEAVGKGSVQIVKNHPEWPRPYNGITAIRYGDIDRDIENYLAESEQRSCALAAASTMNGLLCTSAGGYLVEQLPNAKEETIKKVEENLKKLSEKDGSDQLPTGLFQKGVTPIEIAETVLDGLDMKPLQEIEPKLVCPCTEDRLFRALRLLSREDVEEILEKEEQIEARCQFCGKVYRMGGDDLRERLENATGDPSKA